MPTIDLQYTPAELMSARAEQQLAETRLTETPLLGLLAGTIMLQTQRGIEWGAKLGDAGTSGREVGGPLGVDTKGKIEAAQLLIPNYYFKHQLRVLKRDLVEAASTAKVSSLRDPVGIEINDALMSITQKMNTALYAGVGTLNDTSFGVLGLNEIAKQTGSYAGISRATEPRWRSIQIDGATPGTPEPISVDRIVDVCLARRNAGATSMPNDGSRLVMLTSAVIESKALRKLYLQNTAPVLADGENRTIVGDILPYTRFAADGIPVISDVVPALDNKIMFIDPMMMTLYSFNDADAAAMNDDKISFFSYNGLQWRMALVNDDHPDSIEFEISTSLQLKCHNPKQGLTVLNDVANVLAA
ncbi:MAG: hypothetical protein U5M23_00395 [Marinagarivorans sp.]|nr:hypothetical protein [Marinagarivorans sp.]